MSFLPYSKVRLADGSYKSFNQLVVGESIMTYTEGTGTFTFSDDSGADGTGMNVGTFGTSTIASIDSSSIVEDYINEFGHRGYIINGHKILIKGAGWVDDLILNNTHEYDEAQVLYAKDMNFNTIRFEGFWGKNEDLYSIF